MLSIIGCVLLVFAWAAAPYAAGAGDAGAAQTGGGSARDRLEAELKRYHGFVNAYRDGSNEAVDEIVAWDRDRLTRIIGAAQTALDIFRPWEPARTQAAAMLHTDAAIWLMDRDANRVSFQLELAARILHMAGPDVHPFARSWYTAVSAALRDRTLLFVAEGLLERGRKFLPGDPIILYESGVLQEQIATFAAFITITPTEVPSRRGPAGLRTSGDSHRQVAQHRRALDNAARWFGQSVKRDPERELARLHLGRVQALRGDYNEGSALLRPLADGAANLDTSYLATMFLAAQQQRRGRDADAEPLYREAIKKVPSAQSAHVALSGLLQRLGRGDESRAVLSHVLQIRAVDRVDPWWWYLSEPVGEAEARLNALRAVVRG